MSDKLALYKADWMRVLADVGLGASGISRAIELAELNGLFDPVDAITAERERCARVAENYGGASEGSRNNRRRLGIAAAIRQQTPGA